MSIGQTIKNLNRVREVIQVLGKYGFEDLVINTPLRNFIPKSRQLTWLRHERPVFDYTRWERIRMAAEELGPTYIKFAQVLSNRPDVLPQPLIKEFEKLQSSVPPFETSIARAIIERETGYKINEIFEYFLDRPIGSASIGQVYRAKFIDGDEVVVKVQRPNIITRVETDLSVIHEVVVRGETYFERFGISNLESIVTAFEKTMQRELDYNIEARNMQQFRKFYVKKQFHVPKVYKDFSTEKILVSEYISACKITDTSTMESWGLNPEKIAENGMDVYLSQIFEYGFFHADPHPGNVLVKKDGTIALIDFGMTGRLLKKEKFAFADIFIGMGQQDARKVANSLKRLAINDKIEDFNALEQELKEVVEDFAMLDVQDGSIGNIGVRLQKIVYKHQIELPGAIFLILRALAILEGIGKQIHPHFNIYDFVKPYGKKIVQEQYSPQNILEEVIYRLGQYDTFLRQLPFDLSDLMRKLRTGKLQLEINHTGYTPFIETINKAINRLILTLLIIGIMLTSAIMFNNNLSGEAVTASGYPYFSLLGFFIAIMLSLVLFFNMWRGR